MSGAARLRDTTEHGGVITEGSSNVDINGEPAARLGDYHVCPVQLHGRAHVGGPISSASKSVLINGEGAARIGDALACDSKPLPPPPQELCTASASLGTGAEVKDYQAAATAGNAKTHSEKAYFPRAEAKFSCVAQRITGTYTTALGSATGTIDAVKIEAKGTLGAAYDTASGGQFYGGEGSLGGALLEAKANVTTGLVPIWGTDYGIGLSGEASVSAVAAQLKVSLGVKVDADGTIHIGGKEAIAALFGESLKGEIIIKKLTPPSDLPPDHIIAGSTDVFIGD